jgi:multiple sugar transport system ATP-binding protein
MDGSAFVSASGLRLPLDGAAPPHLAGDVVLGIRPEALHVAGGPWVPEPHATFSARLDVVEPMGNEIYLYARAADHELVARVPPQSLPDPDETIGLAVDLGRLHFFDGKSGGRI